MKSTIQLNKIAKHLKYFFDGKESKNVINKSNVIYTLKCILLVQKKFA